MIFSILDQKIINRVLLAAFFIFAAAKAHAQVVLPACFTDNMILQQQTKVNLWGTEKPFKYLTITTSWNDKTYKIKSDAYGDWKIKVNTPAYGGPYDITFDDGKATVLHNILIGEVWVCSGQSNMEMPLTGFYGDVLNLDYELSDAANYPEIRMLKIENKTSFTLQTNAQTRGGWIICGPQTVRNFSAVAYFFAKNLFKDKHIPIGIINSTWGGTVAEAWTSGKSLKTMPSFAPFVNAIEGGLTQEKLDAQYQSKVKDWIDSINKIDPGFKGGGIAMVNTGI